MKITTAEEGTMQFEEVFNPIIFKTKDGEELVLTMRDTGFEIMYHESMVELKKEKITIHDLLKAENNGN